MTRDNVIHGVIISNFDQTSCRGQVLDDRATIADDGCPAPVAPVDVRYRDSRVDSKTYNCIVRFYVRF